MNKKISIGAALAIALLMVAASIPLTMRYATQQQNDLIPNLPQRMMNFRALEEIRNVVQSNFNAGVDEDELMAEMVRGYINGLGDARSYYMDAEEYAAYDRRIKGQQPELGLAFEYNPDAGGAEANSAGAGGVIVSSVKAHSPADAAGLKAGDQILAAETKTETVFEQEQLTAANAQQRIASLMGIGQNVEESSTSVAITYRRGAETKIVSVMFGDSVPSIDYYLMETAETQGGKAEKTVGYIRIFAFYENTASLLESAVKQLHNIGATKYVFDLRGCGEGTLDYTLKAINLFTRESKGADDVMATVNYTGSRKKSDSFPSDTTDIFPFVMDGLAIMINSGTAGPAELFAYDLANYYPLSVVLVGKPTKGVNTVEKPFPLAEVGGAAMLSVGTVLPVYGDPDWNKGGVQPTPQGGETRPNLVYNANSEESQLQGAIAHLTAGK